MKGTRPLDNDEIRRVSTCFTGIFEVRNRGLFMLGVSTGGRMSELLSLQIGDVWQNRQNVHEMLKKAFIAAGLNGKLATHSLRKSFAQRVYEHSGDIYLVQELLGHKPIATMQKYIGINYTTAREAVETMALGHEPYRMLLLSRSIKKNTDEQLFLELALRGYDLPKLQDNKPQTAENVNIAI